MRSRILALFFTVCVITSWSQTDCDGVRYRYNTAFSDVNVTYDVPYGVAVNATGLNQVIVADIYEPAGDFVTDRPLLIMAHGGFFLGGDNDGVDVIQLCQDLAKMGYVVASITYRLGIDSFFDLEGAMVRAVWRGYHDGKAAVRFFRKTVEEENNPWGIDSDRIIFGGVSAGAFIGLHLAYLDEESEIPNEVNQGQFGLDGGLEGESGSPAYESTVMGVFNICGALKTTDYLSEGDEPLVSVHGTLDETVPYGSGVIALSGIPIASVDGSGTIAEVTAELGIEHCLTTLEGMGHVPHLTSPDAYNATLSTIAGVMSSWLCVSYDPLCGTYDLAAGVSEMNGGASESMRVYPNPSTAGTNWTVQLLDLPHAVWPWEVRDLNGRRVLSGVGSQQETVISAQNLKPGMYVLSIPCFGQTHRIAVQ